MPLSQFDGIAYINLKRRPERKKGLLKELALLDTDELKVHRIEAIDDSFNGIKGCLLSHIKALEFIDKQGWKKGLILEDDAQFIDDPPLIKKEIAHFFSEARENWDVYLLGGWYWRSISAPWERLLQIKYSRRAHAYCVNRHYLPKVHRLFQEGYEATKPHLFYKQSRMFATDILWEELQFHHRWYAPVIPLVFQREAFSDIEHCEKKVR